MADPTLELHDGNGTLIASNDNWQTTIIGGIITSDQVQDIQNQWPRPGGPERICDYRRPATRSLHRHRAWG
jgi:hypothetical protein